MPSKRGGSREGAGAPKKKNKKQTIAICLSPDLIAEIDRVAANRSRFVEEAVKKALTD